MTAHAERNANPPAYVVTVGPAIPGFRQGPGWSRHVTDVAHVVAQGQGRLLVHESQPARVYEGAWPTDRLLVVSVWWSLDAARTAASSDGYRRAMKAAMGENFASVLYGPASDWNPQLPGLWVEAGGPTEPCDQPIYHTTVYEIASSATLPAAAAALAKLDPYRRWGGFPLINRHPLEVIDGAWESRNGILITRWPCRAAFEAWFLNEPYQSTVKPLRIAAGNFIVMAMPSAEHAP